MTECVHSDCIKLVNRHFQQSDIFWCKTCGASSYEYQGQTHWRVPESKVTPEFVQKVNVALQRLQTRIALKEGADVGLEMALEAFDAAYSLGDAHNMVRTMRRKIQEELRALQKGAQLSEGME